MFLIQDSNGKIYNQIFRPAIVYDKATSVLIKIGEFEDMQDFYLNICNQYRNKGFNQYADDLCVFELPKNQEIIDKIFNNTGYIKKIFKEMNLQYN